MFYNVVHLYPFRAPILINIGVPILFILAFLCNIFHVCSGLYECLFCVEGVKNYSYSNLSTLYFGGRGNVYWRPASASRWSTMGQKSSKFIKNYILCWLQYQYTIFRRPRYTWQKSQLAKQEKSSRESVSPFDWQQNRENHKFVRKWPTNTSVPIT